MGFHGRVFFKETASFLLLLHIVVVSLILIYMLSAVFFLPHWVPFRCHLGTIIYPPLLNADLSGC